ncbi:MAG: response regulator [Planctomycetaceae bacterium]|jgi:signal transduction histidine kinase/FixJ family two-component response regulator|nr:response regulator [Planctomycetaceae bacterium]
MDDDRFTTNDTSAAACADGYLTDAIFNAAEDAIFVLTDGAKVPFANNAYKELFPGWEQHRYHEPLDRVRAFYAPKIKDVDVFVKAVETVRRTRKKYETVIHLANGHICQLIGSIVHTASDTVPSACVESEIWTFRDITQRMNNEEKVLAEQTHRIAVEQASIAKSMLLANISHEIRTPLNGVIGIADLMTLTHLTAQQKEYTEQIQNSAKHLLGLIDNILDFSAIEAGKVVIEKTELNLPELLEDVIGILLPRAIEKGLSLRYELLNTIPGRVIGDSARVRQVLINLVGNALKFTQAGSITVTAEDLEPRKTASEFKTVIRFTVTDTGIGIPQNKIDRIRKPFSQTDDSTSRKYGGIGLGLTVSTELVNLMGGASGIESREGVGSTFWFTLPFKIPVLSEYEVISQTSGVIDYVSQIDTTTKRQLLILAAEDDRITQAVISEVLTQSGYSFEIVGNGRLAYEAFARKKYALLLMDCQMPVIDGLEAAKMMRAMETANRAMPAAGMLSTGSNGGTPIIALTTSGAEEEIKRCRSAGMDDYCTKPIQGGELLRMIEKWLKKSLQYQQNELLTNN